MNVATSTLKMPVLLRTICHRGVNSINTCCNFNMRYAASDTWHHAGTIPASNVASNSIHTKCHLTLILNHMKVTTPSSDDSSSLRMSQLRGYTQVSGHIDTHASSEQRSTCFIQIYCASTMTLLFDRRPTLSLLQSALLHHVGKPKNRTPTSNASWIRVMH